MTQLQFLGDRLVAINVCVVQVIQQPAPFPYPHQESPAGAVVLAILLQMVGQMIDLLREQSDLHVGRAGVFLVQLKLLYDFSFNFRFGFHSSGPLWSAASWTTASSSIFTTPD